MSRSTEKVAYRWLLQQVSPVKRWLVLSLFLGLASALLFIVQAALLAHTIHELVMTGTSRENLLLYLPGIALVLMLRAGCQWGREVTGFRAGAEIRAIIRAALLDKLRRLGPVAIARQAAGSWTTILVEQVEEVHDFVARYLPQMVLAALVPLIFIVVALPFNWAAAVIFLVTAPLIPLFMILVGMKAAEANRRNFQALGRLGGFFLDRLQAMETLRLFQACERQQLELNQASEGFRIKTMQVLRLAFLSSTVLEFFASVSIAILAVYLGMNFLGYLNFGSWGQGVTLFSGLFLLLLAPDFYQPLRDLGTHYHARAKAIAASEEIMALLDQAEPEQAGGSKRINPDQPFRLQARSLSVFSVDGVPLLDNLSFSIKGGERVAIIGPSGAGKSTLVNTLMGFWPYQGQLQVVGESLAQLDMQDWRRQIAWLGQQPLIIHGSVYDNVCFGRQLDRDQVTHALRKAQAMDFVEHLSEGTDTLLQEQGGNLSVGQAQRIALARALAEPVKLLILDEPTASLDALSERLVLDTLAAIPDDCTVITITHRLDQLEAMSRIITLGSGRLVETDSAAQPIQPDNSEGAFIEALKQEQGVVAHG